MADCIDCGTKLGLMRRGRCESCEARHQETLDAERAAEEAELDRLREAVAPLRTDAADLIEVWANFVESAAPRVDSQRCIDEVIDELREFANRTQVPESAWWAHAITPLVIARIRSLYTNGSDDTGDPFDQLVLETSERLIGFGFPELVAPLKMLSVESQPLSAGEALLGIVSADLAQHRLETEERVDFVGGAKEGALADVFGGTAKKREVVIRDEWEVMDTGTILITSSRVNFTGDYNKIDIPIGSLGGTTHPSPRVVRLAPGGFADSRFQSDQAEELATLVGAAFEVAAGRGLRASGDAPIPGVPGPSRSEQPENESLRFLHLAEWILLVGTEPGADPRIAPEPWLDASKRLRVVDTPPTHHRHESGTRAADRERADDDQLTDALHRQDPVDHPFSLTFGELSLAVGGPENDPFSAVCLLFRLRNHAKQPIELSLSEFSLLEADGTRFDADFRFTLRLPRPIRPEIPVVAPRLEKKVFLAFEVPTDVKPAMLLHTPGAQNPEIPSSLWTIPAGQSASPALFRFDAAMNWIDDTVASVPASPPILELPEGSPAPSDSAAELLDGLTERDIQVGDLLAWYGMKRLTEAARDRLRERLVADGLAADPPPETMERYGSTRIFQVPAAEAN